MNKEHLLAFLRLVNCGAPQEPLADAMEATPTDALAHWVLVCEAVAEHARSYGFAAGQASVAKPPTSPLKPSGWRSSGAQGERVPPEVRQEMKEYIKSGKGPTFLVERYGISTTTATKIRQEADAEKFDTLEAARKSAQVQTHEPASTQQPGWAVET